MASTAIPSPAAAPPDIPRRQPLALTVRTVTRIATLAAALLLTACGSKGPLTLPPKVAPVAVTPATPAVPTSSADGSTATPAPSAAASSSNPARPAP